MMTNLLEIIKSAERDISIYRDPDLTEFRAATTPILKALGRTPLGGDAVESIRFESTYVTITTSYSCRGCKNENIVSIPLSVVNAPDPVRAATENMLISAVSKAQTQYDYAAATLPKLEALLRESETALATFLKEQP